MRIQLAVVLVIGVLVIAAGGCDRGGEAYTASGSSRIGKMATERGLPLPTFQRFDGKYPADWPQGVTLPAGYLLADPPLELDPAKNDAAQSAGYRLIDFEGLSPLGIEETITWFRGQFKQAGYTADRDALLETPPGSQEITWIVGKGSHELQFTGGPQPRIVNVMIKVWLDQDLGQFAYVMGSITVDTNR